jgi:hypothetical protein
LKNNPRGFFKYSDKKRNASGYPLFMFLGNDVSCNRGISILSAIPKLFEKMVCDRTTPVVNLVISDTQYGFVKDRSTVSNLVQFTNGVIGEIEDGW